MGSESLSTVSGFLFDRGMKMSNRILTAVV